MKERRWKSGTSASVEGVAFRVVVGRKETGDLRLEWQTANGWQAISMAAAFLMTDFFVENEEHLKQYRPHWTKTGAEYFFGELWDAVNRGWEVPAERLRGQRERLGTTANATTPRSKRDTPPTPRWCGAEAPDGTEVCTKEPGHDWAHAGPSQYWPQAAT